MAVMSPLEVLACNNPGWRLFTARVVVPWVFGGQILKGDVLEVGTGAGANAAALLERYPDIRLTATDLDPRMLESARKRLTRFSDRVRIQPGDAVSLRFDDASFDAVVSMIMLHHVGDWRAAVSEVARVLRPGGRFVGYDLSRRGPAGWAHRRNRDPGHDLIAPDELGQTLRDLRFGQIRVDSGARGLVARFSARKEPSS